MTGARNDHGTTTTADDLRWLDDTERLAWRSFLSLHAQIAAKLNQDLQKTSGLSLADYDILVHLTDVPEGRRRGYELCDALGWQKSRLSKQVSRMATRGLVVREECDEDRRGMFVVLTPKGRAAIEAAAPAHVDLVRELVFDGMSGEQVAAMAATLRDLLARVEEHEAE